MRQFLDDNFLLHNPTAEHLYFGHAQKQLSALPNVGLHPKEWNLLAKMAENTCHLNSIRYLGFKQ